MLLLLTQHVVPAEVQPLTLYQKAARASLVAHVRAVSSSTRRPVMQVMEVLKGTYPAPELKVVPHFEDNTQPTPWLDREVFEEGEESILFLVPYVDEFGRGRGEGTFSILTAAAGKLEIPTEGGEALFTALRGLLVIQSLPDHEEQVEAIRGLFTATNPYLVEAALQESRRFRLAEMGDLDALLDLTQAPRPDFRSGALILMGQVVHDARVRETNPPLPGGLFERVTSSARFDPDPEAREAAVGVLEEFASEPALRLLESISKADISQSVRYVAAAAAHRLAQRFGGSKGKPGEE